MMGRNYSACCCAAVNYFSFYWLLLGFDSDLLHYAFTPYHVVPFRCFLYHRPTTHHYYSHCTFPVSLKVKSLHYLLLYSSHHSPTSCSCHCGHFCKLPLPATIFPALPKPYIFTLPPSPIDSHSIILFPVSGHFHYSVDSITMQYA